MVNFERRVGSYTLTRTCEDGPREEARVRTTIENVKENSRSVSGTKLFITFEFKGYST